jgi:hypothetical protein
MQAPLILEIPRNFDARYSCLLYIVQAHLILELPSAKLMGC